MSRATALICQKCGEVAADAIAGSLNGHPHIEFTSRRGIPFDDWGRTVWVGAGPKLWAVGPDVPPLEWHCPHCPVVLGLSWPLISKVGRAKRLQVPPVTTRQ